MLEPEPLELLDPPELRALPELLLEPERSLPLERVLLGREEEPVLRLLPSRV